MTPKFETKVENFPDDILCPLCIHQEYCGEEGLTCKTLDAMCDDIGGIE